MVDMIVGSARSGQNKKKVCVCGLLQMKIYEANQIKLCLAMCGEKVILCDQFPFLSMQFRPQFEFQ